MKEAFQGVGVQHPLYVGLYPDAGGDTQGALAAFTTALLLPGSDALDRNYLQMKAGSLIVASDAEPPADAEVLQEVDLGAVAEPIPESVDENGATEADTP